MKYDVTHILTSLKNDVKGTEKDIYKYETRGSGESVSLT